MRQVSAANQQHLLLFSACSRTDSLGLKKKSDRLSAFVLISCKEKETSVRLLMNQVPYFPGIGKRTNCQ